MKKGIKHCFSFIPCGSVKEIFDFIEEACAFLIVVGLAEGVEILQSFFLFVVEVAGNFDGDFDILVTSAFGVEVLDTLALEFKDITGLSAGMDVVADLAVEGGDDNFMTESSLSECQGYLAPYIITLAFKDVMTFDIDVNMEIT